MRQNLSPFYPLTGKNRLDVLYLQLPPTLEGKNKAGQFLISLFSVPKNVSSCLKNDNAADKDNFLLHPPFNRPFAVPDLRQGGFGYFFGAALILCLLLSCTTGFAHKRNKRLFLFVSGLITCTVLFNPVNWWARFYSAAVESVPFDIVFRYACAKRYSEKKDCFFRNLRSAFNK